MSLIEEALRRVQTLPPPAQRPEAIPQTPEIRAIPMVARPRYRSASQIPWLGVVIGSAGVLLLGWVIWTMMVLVRPTSVPQSVPAPSPRRARIALPTRPYLALSGIVGGPGEPIAIINGRLLAPGETIEGATLLDVTGDSARLRWRDEDVVLRLAR